MRTRHSDWSSNRSKSKVYQTLSGKLDSIPTKACLKIKVISRGRSSLPFKVKDSQLLTTPLGKAQETNIMEASL